MTNECSTPDCGEFAASGGRCHDCLEDSLTEPYWEAEKPAVGYVAPSVTEMKAQLTADQIAGFASVASSLQESLGPVEPGFNLTGWVWMQVALAQRHSIPSWQVTTMLDELYQELLEHQSRQAQSA